MSSSLEQLKRWLVSVVKDLGKDATKVVDDNMNGLLCFCTYLPEGRLVNIVIYKSTQEGYFLLSCPSALKSLVQFDERMWARACSLFELLYDYPDSPAQDGAYYGMATIRIKPQSAKQLRLELVSFLSRIEAAVAHFNQKQSATG